MNIPRFAVRYPVTVIMIISALTLVGVAAFFTLNVDLFPNIDFPLAFIQTPYPGVDPAEMENIVTRKIEEEVNTVENIKKVVSYSFEGFSWINVEFIWGTNIDLAAVDLREKVDVAKRKLPRDIEQVTVSKLDFNSQPVMDLSIGGDYDLKTLRRLADKEVKPVLERISGIANVEVSGGLEREIRVKVFPEKVKSFDLTINDVIDAVAQNNQNTPIGNITEGKFKFLIRSQGEAKSPKDLGNIVVKTIQGRPVYLSEMAVIEDSYKDLESVSRLNMKPAVSLSLKKEANANPIKISDAVKKLIPRIEGRSQGKLKITIGNDRSDFVRDSLEMVKENAVSGSILALVIIFIYLWNIRATIIIGISIPLSVVMTFGFMYLKEGMFLNLMTLGGLALGIGMMVDNSIVVLENTYRLLADNKGENREECSINGANEVTLAILASTLTTQAVFLPIGFVPGIVGEIFLHMSLAIVFSLGASFLVAIFVVPLMCAHTLKVPKSSKEYVMDAFKWVYRKILGFLLCHWIVRVAYVIGILWVCYMSLSWFPPMEFFPKMDRGIFVIGFEPPEGTSVEATDAISFQMEEKLRTVPEVERIVSRTRLAEGNITVVLLPKEKRKRTTNEVVMEVRQSLSKIPGYRNITFSEPKMGGPHGGKPMQIEVSGEDFTIVEKICLEIADKIKTVQGLKDIDSGVKEGRPEIRVDFDRQKLGDLGESLSKLANMTRTYIYGTIAGTYREKNEEYDIRVEAQDKYKDDISKFKNLEIMVDEKKSVNLAQISKIYDDRGYTKIERRNLKRVITVQADIEKRPLQSVINDIRPILKTVVLPTGYEVRFGGEDEEMMEAFKNLGIALFAAILLVYMVMASQFESFFYPFIIMFTIPLSIIGVAGALRISGFAFSITAMIGIIMLAGIVVNNGIILIDNINERRKLEKIDKISASLDSGCVRLRPIMLTVLTTVLGMLPLSLGIGAGSDFYQPLAITVIGGLSVSTIMTLTYIPVLYVIVDDIVEFLLAIIKKFV